MFTGIIENTGKIINISKNSTHTTFTVSTSLSILKKKKKGQSISVNGVCTTITSLTGNKFTFDAIPETLERTNLGDLKKDEIVNLESALTLNQPLDGHLVQGHVDTTGKVISLSQKDKVRLQIAYPEEISKYLAFKGSICCNGVSLTISDLQEANFTVDLIPLTLEKTNLGKVKKDHKVNLEVDLISRYLERIYKDKESEATYEFLKDRGLI